MRFHQRWTALLHLIKHANTLQTQCMLCWCLLCILLYLAHAVKTSEGDWWQEDKKPVPFLNWGFPLEAWLRTKKTPKNNKLAGSQCMGIHCLVSWALQRYCSLKCQSSATLSLIPGKRRLKSKQYNSIQQRHLLFLICTVNYDWFSVCSGQIQVFLLVKTT